MLQLDRARMVAQEANRFRAKPNKMLAMWQAAPRSH
jgi:hypothetical protein